MDSANSVTTDILEVLPCGVLTLTGDGAVVSVNRFLREALGRHDAEECADLTMQELLPVAGRIFMQTHVMPLLQMQGQVDEIFLNLLTTDGRSVPMLMNGRRLGAADDDARFVCSLMPMRLRHEYEGQVLQLKQQADHDSREKARLNTELARAKQGLEAKQAELLQAMEELRRLASTDPLTGLRNKRIFQQDLAAQVALALRRQTSLALLIVDADNFKDINDRYGHPVGDRYLVHFARLLRSLLRETDAAARYGGEEFAILLPDTDAAGAALVAEKIRNVVEQASWDREGITVSIGGAVLPEDASSAERLLSLADRALYRSKRDGRNRVTFAGFAPDTATNPVP